MITANIYQVKGSSNLSVDKIYSVVALRQYAFLNQIMCDHIIVRDKEELFNSSTLQLMLFVVLRNLYHSPLNIGQRRRKQEFD